MNHRGAFTSTISPSWSHGCDRASLQGATRSPESQLLCSRRATRKTSLPSCRHSKPATLHEGSVQVPTDVPTISAIPVTDESLSNVRSCNSKLRGAVCHATPK